MQTASYDIIILGAGCAGLSLLLRLADDPLFSTKRVLLVDREPKTKNDRTWCFWETTPGYFESLVTQCWDRLLFKSNDFTGELDIAPYRYKMIRGIDFYTFCFQQISRHANIEVLYDDVLNIRPEEIQLRTRSIDRGQALIFSSLYTEAPRVKHKHYLLQHFKGWLIETVEDRFDAGCATLMDFTIHQANGTSFVYVMPLTANRALIEYTLFSKNLLDPELYDRTLRTYISEYLKIDHFRLAEEEFGVIPMTNAFFPAEREGVYHIGTSGGQTKPSTGYTFQFIQKQSGAIAENLKNGRLPFDGFNTGANRFSFYDSVLLNVLAGEKVPGDKVFSRLFKKNKASQLFRFLDNETSIGEELGVMRTVPQVQFIKAAIAEYFR